VGALPRLRDAVRDEEVGHAGGRVVATAREIERPAAPRPHRHEGDEGLDARARSVPRRGHPDLVEPRGIEAAHAEALLLASPRAQPLTRDLPELGQDMLVLGPLVERILIGKVERDFDAGVVELARGAPYVPHGRALESEFLGIENRILADVERAPAAARLG